MHLNIIACVTVARYYASYYCCLGVILVLYPMLCCIGTLEFSWKTDQWANWSGFLSCSLLIL